MDPIIIPSSNYIPTPIHSNRNSLIKFSKRTIQQTAAVIQSVGSSLLCCLPSKSRLELKKFVNFAMKRPIEGIDTAPQKRMHTDLDGQSKSRSLETNYLYAKEFLASLGGEDFNDFEGLNKIIEHRKSMRDLNRAAPWRRPKLYLKKVQALPENSSFSFAGGCIGHYVTYEVRREKDDYYFVVHNRGFGRDPKIHGTFKEKLDGKIYAKTSVSIRVKPELLDAKFFRRLELSSMAYLDMAPAYNVIQKRLLEKGGEIQISPQEKAWEEQSNKSPEMASRMIKEDPAFHTTQSFGTCSESNLTGPEKELAKPETLKALKLFTILQLTDKISKSRWISKETKEEIAVYSRARRTKLEREI